MATTISEELVLLEPISLSRPKPRGWSREFRQQLKISVLALLALIFISWAWDAFSMPTFFFQDRELQWIFPLVAVLAILFSTKFLDAIQKELELRADRSRDEMTARFQSEAFPFLRREILKLNSGDEDAEFVLPPEDWLAAMIVEDASNRKGSERASWGSRYGDSEEFASYYAYLEDAGRRVRFVAKLPKGV